MFGMRRRDFVALLGGAALASPVAARAQQPGRMRRVGVLMGVAESDPEGQARIAAFRQGLSDLGWADSRNLRIEYRWAAGDADRIRAYAAELVALAPDVLVGNGAPVLTALRDATRSIPIVFVLVNDPVGQGFIANLARPGGNITGFSFLEYSMVGKSLEILRQLAPNVHRVAIMFNPATAAPLHGLLAFIRDCTATKSAGDQGSSRRHRSRHRTGRRQARQRTGQWPACSAGYLHRGASRPCHQLSSAAPRSGNFYVSAIRPRRGPYLLRTGDHGYFSALGVLRRSHLERCQPR